MKAVTGSVPDTLGVTGPDAPRELQLAPEMCSGLRSDPGTAPEQWTEHSS
jgi:hypothetical protein